MQLYKLLQEIPVPKLNGTKVPSTKKKPSDLIFLKLFIGTSLSLPFTPLHFLGFSPKIIPFHLIGFTNFIFSKLPQSLFSGEKREVLFFSPSPCSSCSLLVLSWTNLVLLLPLKLQIYL